MNYKDRLGVLWQRGRKDGTSNDEAASGVLAGQAVATRPGVLGRVYEGSETVEGKEDLTVFDFGMHNGDDTAYYLERGFKVVSVEANIELVDKCRVRFEEQISRGDLRIISKAIGERDGCMMEFHISSLNSEWSTIHHNPHTLGDNPKKVIVEAVTLGTLIRNFGVPHYIKCDLEGSDIVFCRQLLEESTRPDFVSVEATSLDLLAILVASGYDAFQLVNNAKTRRFASRRTYTDSVYGSSSGTITGHCSGEFGFDLAVDKWIAFEDAAYRWLKHADLQKTDPDMVIDNWFDFHATTGSVLKRLVRR